MPSSLNWVEEGLIGPVRTQGACGSCYAIAAAAALECRGKLQKYWGLDVRLSPQELVDCGDDYGTMGCDSGGSTNSFRYVYWENGLNSEGDYPYVGID